MVNRKELGMAQRIIGEGVCEIMLVSDTSRAGKTYYMISIFTDREIPLNLFVNAEQAIAIKNYIKEQNSEAEPEFFKAKGKE